VYSCPLCDWVSTNKDDAKALKEREMHLKYYHNHSQPEKATKANPEQSGLPPCPQCGGSMIPGGGCWICQSCGFDKCG